MQRKLAAGLALLCGVLLAPGALAAVTVETFSPQGTVKAVRQVAARFSKPVVRFGDPRLDSPFTVDCPVPGRARWADGRNWVYDFEQDLPGGAQCRFTLKPDFKTVSGESFGGKKSFSFNTGGPAIRASMPEEGAEDVDENQAFLLALDAPATADSVVKYAYCVVDGLEEKIPLQVIAGDERAKLLAQREQLGYEYFRILWKNGRQSIAQAKDRSPQAAEALVVAARCGRALPPETQVQIVWGKGIATASGAATTEDQTLAFKTRAAFTASFSCQRTNAKAACLPMTPMSFAFTAPVSRKLAEQIRLSGDGHGWKAKPEDGDMVQNLTFDGPFPERGRFRLELPPGLVDDSGRTLGNAARFPLEVQTAEAPPLAKFGADFGILELNEGGVLPVSLRNVEAQLAASRSDIPAAGIAGSSEKIDDDAAIASWLKRVSKANESSGEWDADTNKWIEHTGEHSLFDGNDRTEAFSLPKPNSPETFEVVGIPLKAPGFYVVELQSPKLGAALLGDGRIRYVSTSALVTNMAVHFEWGRESSVVFVTALDSASPVPNAAVRVTDYCTGAELWSGRADASGIARIDGVLPQPTSWGSGCEGGDHALMVSARAGGDLSFTLSTWNSGITPGDFQMPVVYAQPDGPVLVHTVLDRALFRQGETVSMKHFLREHGAAGMRLPKAYPDTVVLRHEGSDQTYTIPLQWDAHGAAISSWDIPKDAKLGTYSISLVYGGNPEDSEHSLSSGSFRVEQYRVPTMRAIVQGPKEPLVNADQANLDLFVSYLSGGGAGFLPVKLRTQVQPKALSFPGYDAFHFGGDEVKEGIESGGGHGAFYDEEEEDASDDNATPGAPARVMPLSLDGQGAARATVPRLGKSAVAQDLAVELEYQDANGETLSASASVALWPSSVVLGIQPDGWVATKDDLRFKVLALDLHGQPISGQRIAVDGFQRITHSYRRRLVGGFYSYDNSVETRRIGHLCDGRTDTRGLLSCKVSTDQSGQLVIQATALDGKGNRALASNEIWVAGGDDWWFEAGPSDRMDVLPEKPAYESGDTARFQVRMPFREATALVTVEREGVIDSFVTHLSGKDPVVEVPIKDGYSPNVYVSVLAMRGRVGGWRTRLADLVRWLHLPFHVEGGSPTALVDLSKPAYRLGIGRINVGWDPHRLEVKVMPSADTFKVRDTAHVSIAVKPARGGKLPADAAVAVAAVDEGLLELMPNDSWKLLEAMMSPRGLEVTTSTAQMQVVGKRHYGRKAGAPGGGGGAGRGPARELFDTLLLWKGTVPLDAAGKAQLDIPLNDSLTSFRIVAIATAGAEQFGTGSASIRTTQELQLVSGLPALLREGDHLNATVTVRNASSRKITASVGASFKAKDAPATALPPQTVQIDAGAAREVSWPVDVPVNSSALDWDITAQEQGGAAADHLKLSQPVIAAYPVRTYQATLTQVDGSTSLPVERPKEAIAGRGGVQVDLRAHLGDGLDGVIEYMTAYPYICFEQRVSTAIVTGDDAAWAHVMNLLPSHMDRDGLVEYFPVGWLQGSDTLTAYVLAIAGEAGRDIPDDSRERMIAALKKFVAGQLVRDSALPTADLSIRKLAAISALARYGKTEPAMLSSISVEPNLWPTSALLDWIDILHRLPALPKHDERLDEALQILRSRLNFQGTTMGFSTEHDDALWWLMINADVNANRAVLETLPEAQWREDVPRMVRGALSRQLSGRWNTTVANAWGMLAMRKFGAAFESEAVSGSTRASLAGQTQNVDWTHPSSLLDFAWPGQPATLEIQHSGGGKPWAMISSRAALPLQAPLFTGYTIKRTVTPVEQKKDGVWTRGDVARIHLDLEAQSDMTWVVVDDPVPAGASIQGTGLGGSSAILTQGEKHDGKVWPAYEEKRFDAFRSYFVLVPKGRWSVEYTVRYNASGTFELPATRVEAMYAPEMFGEWPNPALEVQAP